VCAAKQHLSSIKKTKPKDKLPAVFLNEYQAEGTIIDRDNFRDFIFPLDV
jgi:hypothetical protein